MYTRKEIIEIVKEDVVNNEGIIYVTDLLEEIQNYIVNKGHTCNFTKQCGDENWDYAYAVAERSICIIINIMLSRLRILLKDTRLFQDFVERVSKPIKRLNKINSVLDETV